MYRGVPSTWPVSVSDASASASRLARPKSVTSRVPWESTRTFEGFRSRCKTPRWWAWWTARTTAIRPATSARAIAARVLRQRGPLDELHREVLLALVLADLVDRHDVGMVEVGRRLGLGAEPLDVAARGEAAGEDHLERDDPVERRLPRLVDDPHPAPGDLLQQLVVAEVADGRQRGVAVRLDRAGRVQPAGQPQRGGDPVHAVEVGEEGAQRLGHARGAGRAAPGGWGPRRPRRPHVRRR